MATGNEVLVQLVRGRIGDADSEGGELAPERAQEQRAENRVLGDVGQLPERDVPASEPGAEVGHGREGEDHRRPENDRQPAGEGRLHGSMLDE